MLDWQKYIEIADKFQHKAKYQDREDLRQDIILRLAEVASNNGHKLFTEWAMYRVASYGAMEYWRDLKRLPTLTVTSETVEDSEGHETELYQTLADDKAIDLDNWIDCKAWLCGCPRKLVRIAYTKAIGKALNDKERQYLSRYRKSELAKKQLVLS